MNDSKRIVDAAWENGFVIPAFDIPYLPMVKPLIEAIRAENSFALIQVARMEWRKLEAVGFEAVRDEYKKWEDTSHVRLHLDHIPVIDEDNLEVDYIPIIEQAVNVGYQSVMVDGSRLALEKNIAATKSVCDIVHKFGVPCEAELGAVLGHEQGPLPPYEELYDSGMGFTKLDEAERFVSESGCDWLSVAIGNIHGSIAETAKGRKKPEARINIDLLKKLKEATGIPLVLHGGSGVKKAYMMEAIKNGIAKINVGTEMRQAYQKGFEMGSTEAGRDFVYQKAREMINEYFEISGTANIIKQYV